MSYSIVVDALILNVGLSDNFCVGGEQIAKGLGFHPLVFTGTITMSASAISLTSAATIANFTKWVLWKVRKSMRFGQLRISSIGILLSVEYSDIPN